MLAQAPLIASRRLPQAIEDKTFGLKNKKSAKVQK